MKQYLGLYLSYESFVKTPKKGHSCFEANRGTCLSLFFVFFFFFEGGKLACEQGSQVGYMGKRKLGERGTGARKKRKGACGHSLNAAVFRYQILIS